MSCCGDSKPLTANQRMRRFGLLVLALGIGLGAALRGLVSAPREAAPQPASVKQGQWTCSTHSQVRLDHPGQCPICGMDLVPVGARSDAAPLESLVLTLDPQARAMAQVETAPVASRLLVKELRTVGRVELDETAVSYVTARVEGRVDEVFADFPGTPVRAGDHLVRIYSPELYATQQELLLGLTLEREHAPRERESATLAATRTRLELWGITKDQVEAVVKSGRPLSHLVVRAPLSGTVIEKSIRAGQYVKTGDALFTLADLGRVWVVLEVYERELQWVRFGQPVALRLESEPGRVRRGRLGFVEPVLTDATRSVRARVVFPNEDGALRPGMFVEALLQVPLRPDGRPGPTGLEGRHACPMHPYVVQPGPGSCTACGMALRLVPGAPDEPGPVLAVPAEAVLTTGRRSLVYVEEQPGHYRLVEPSLGPVAGDFQVVLGGLRAGQRVVVRGNFLLDSQFQISGKPSLLYPEGAGGAGAGHAHHGAPGEAKRGAGPGHEVHAPPPGPEEHRDHAPAPPRSAQPRGPEAPPPERRPEPPAKSAPADPQRGHEGHRHGG